MSVKSGRVSLTNFCSFSNWDVGLVGYLYEGSPTIDNYHCLINCEGFNFWKGILDIEGCWV